MPLILITAGEPSGDRLGAALMAALKKKRNDLGFIGVGGPLMEAQGLKSAFPMSDLSVMGLAEVVPAIPRILARINQLVALADREGPALAVVIDAQDFSARLAGKLQHLPLTGRGVPVVHYVAPKVWAWRQGRVKKLHKIYKHLLTVLPFEGPFFQRAGIATTYVGHPALNMLAPYMVTNNQSPVTSHQLALLPGSRGAEFKQHWPLLLETYRTLRKQVPNLKAVLALPDEKALATCQQLASWGADEEITPVYGEARFKALTQCRAALAKSGTNNLELALLGVPAVICYRMNPLTYQLAKWLVRVPYVSLPNLVLNPQAVGQRPHARGAGEKAPVYPEYLQGGATAKNLASALYPLLTDARAYTRQTAQLAKMRAALQTPTPPAQMAADAVLSHLR